MTNIINFHPGQAATRPQTLLLRCTCDTPRELDDGRHQTDCVLAPNLAGWLFYPHDGELEAGGVYVHPADKSRIFLLVRGYLCPADAAAGGAGQ